MRRLVQLGAAVLGIAVLSGCASIIKGSSQDISIRSTPTDASVRVVDEGGDQIFSGRTPASVTLTKKKGYFSGKTYTVTIEQAGYDPVEVAVKPRASGWYVGGNIVFGGLIGWFIVDPLTGAMWTYEPEAIDQTLGEQVSFDGTSQVSVVLLEQVPLEIRDKMVPVN